MKLFEQFKKNFPKPLYENAIFSYELVRAATFLTQNLSLPIFEYLLTRQNKTFTKDFPVQMQKALKDLVKLLRKDAIHISRGVYPLDVLKPEPVSQFLARYPQIIADGVSISQRRLERKAHDFDQEAREYFREVPDYYQRNFHYQTGGYLTEKSAALYEHQVEILFAGAADAMRRLLLAPMKKHFDYGQGEGLHFLEVAAGTGRLTRFVKLAFPKARITVMDLSSPYLKVAQNRLSEFSRLNFVQGDGADLPFKADKFDAVFSCFLFHELPIEERRKVVSEGFRVLRPGGFYGLVDSIQSEDKKEFEWALSQFPVDFHEPFFKNYIQNPMDGLLLGAGFHKIDQEVGFLSKVVSGIKPFSS
ncbi:MAG: methyltransferase domain-containing protein [Pseudobdellovibrionaceae bacterium]|jgi:ubiquinone/menaquinone biosynthesis C-methylase UbiE